MNSYIYLIRCAETDYYKIGIADDAEARRKALQLGCPYSLTIIMTCLVSSKRDAKRVESETHQKLSDYRVHSEWFALPAVIVEKLKNEMLLCSE